MRKKVFLMIAFLVLSFLFFTNVSATEVEIDHNAELEKECKLSRCYVPIPTLVKPDGEIYNIDKPFYLTGLTWNNTEIDIYVDDQYYGSATVVKDDDSPTGNFYFLVDQELSEGQHQWKVIAWTETRWQRSFVSQGAVFFLESPIREDLDSLITPSSLGDAEESVDENVVDVDQDSEQPDLETGLEDQDISAISEEAEREVFVSEENIEGEVIISESFSDENIEVIEGENEEILVNIDEDKEIARIDETTGSLQPATPDEEEKAEIMGDLDINEKQERNRSIGIWLLITLIVIVIFSTLFSGKKKIKQKKDEDDNHPQQKDLFN